MLVALLHPATVVSADDGAGTLYVEPVPLPVPILPAPIPAVLESDLPDLALPEITLPEYPSVVNQIDALGAQIDAALAYSRGVMNSQFADATRQLSRVRTAIFRVRAIVGSPLDIEARSDSSKPKISVYEAAADLSSGISVSMMYLRGLSEIGATGLDLAFVFVGILWLAFVNLASFLLDAIFAIVKFISKLIAWILQFVELLMSFIRTILAFLPF